MTTSESVLTADGRGDIQTSGASPSGSPYAPVAQYRHALQEKALYILSCTFFCVAGWITVEGDPLITDQAPAGIISFEVAGSKSNAASMLASWDTTAREAFMFVQGIDTLFLIVYPAWLSLACAVVARTYHMQHWVAKVTSKLVWGVWIAGLCDLSENIALMVQFRKGASATAALVAAIMATIKFIVAFGALALVIVAGGPTFVRYTGAKLRAC